MSPVVVAAIVAGRSRSGAKRARAGSVSTFCHPREGGDPVFHHRFKCLLDSRLRGNDKRGNVPVFPAKPIPRQRSALSSRKFASLASAAIQRYRQRQSNAGRHTPRGPPGRWSGAATRHRCKRALAVAAIRRSCRMRRHPANRSGFAIRMGFRRPDPCRSSGLRRCCFPCARHHSPDGVRCRCHRGWFPRSCRPLPRRHGRRAWSWCR